MNLIDFHVTKVTGPTTKTEHDWGTVWYVPVEYWDDGGNDQAKAVICFSEEEANRIKPGYVGQH